jgi:bacteriocin biosynthesis cyclodehydratase domain-containing protein
MPGREMVYTRNPAVSWARTEPQTYVINLGSRLVQLAGPAAAFVFEEFLPSFERPMTRSQIVERPWSRPAGDIERALTATCSLSALLSRSGDAPVGVHDVLRLELGGEAEEPAIALRLDVVDPRDRIASILDAALDGPHEIVRHANVHALIAARRGAAHRSTDEAWPHALAVVVDDADDALSLANANRSLIAASAWWIPVRVAAAHGSVGPLVIPFQTACFECAVIRHASISSEAKLLHRLELDDGIQRSPSVAPPVSGAIAHQVAGTLASELLLYAAPPSMPGLISRIVSVSHVSMGARYHRILRVPTCPSCGLSPVVPRHPWERLSVNVSDVVGHEIDG